MLIDYNLNEEWYGLRPDNAQSCLKSLLIILLTIRLTLAKMVSMYYYGLPPPKKAYYSPIK